ncbi:hypothetical protein GGI07_005084 [Coemansia sp. Benny D115]|nr:hypothetical protein GGI07_005084 [Coemansia sp. Benny D115]
MAQEQKVVAEEVVEQQQTETPVAPAREQSAAEKKARKAMQKKGLIHVPGVANISVLRKKTAMFSIYSPDVYKNSTSDTWIVFGEARMDNFGRPSGSAYQRAPRPAAAEATGTATAATAEAAAPAAESSAAAAEAEEAVDESGVDSKDIELVMAQANCSRAKAVSALKSNANDVVNAIMELTS